MDLSNKETEVIVVCKGQTPKAQTREKKTQFKYLRVFIRSVGGKNIELTQSMAQVKIKL